MSLAAKMMVRRRRELAPSVRPSIMAAHAKVRRAEWRRAMRKAAGRYPW